ncbi:lipopolysaccharide biosynthesis protein, partial [Pseudomonas aeruginosa]
MRLEAERFWHQVAAVLTGSAVAQVIPVLGSLVLARLFLPSEFGLYATWQGIALFFAVAITGRFEMALAMVSDGEPRKIAVLATLLTTVLASGLLAIFVTVLYFLSPSWLQQTPAILGAIAIPSAFLIASGQVWQSWAAAEGEYKKLSLMRIASALAITVAQIAIGLKWASATGLALGHLVGVSIGFLTATIIKPMNGLPANLAAGVLSFWTRYRRLPIISLPADMINTAAAQLPLIIVTSRFGLEVSGYLALSMRTLGAPIALLGRAVLDVFRRHAAVRWREGGECRSTYVQTFWVLSAGSIAAMSGLLWFGEDIFVLSFGERWRHAGVIAVWLLPM